MELMKKEYLFLKNFDKRMEKFSILSVLNYRSYYKDTFKNFGFNDYQEITNFMLSVLLYIVDKTLTDDYCFFEDIKSFVREIVEEYFNPGKVYSSEEYLNLTQLIIDIFANTEEYKVFDFEKREYMESPMYTKLVVDKLDINVSETNPIYYVPNNVLDFIFATLEYNIYYAISTLQVKFEESMRLKDYRKSHEELKKIIQIEKQRIREIKDQMLRAKDNVREFYANTNFQKSLSNNINLLNEHLIKYKAMRNSIELTEKEIEALIEENENKDSELVLKDRENQLIVSEMKTGLDVLIGKQNELLTAHLQLQNSTYESLMSLLTSRIDKTIDINKEFIKNSYLDSNQMDNALLMMNFLFPVEKKLKKYFNLNKCIEEQKPIRERDKNDNKDIEFLDTDNSKIEAAKLLNQSIKNQYTDIVKTLFNIILFSDTKSISLEKLSRISEEEESFNILFEDIRKFSYVLFSILREQEIVKDEIKEKKESAADQSRYEFNLYRALWDIYGRQVPFRKLYIKKLSDEQDVRFREKQKNDINRLYFDSSNYLLVMEME